MQTNATILTAAWLAGTSDFQQRVPAPSVATQSQMVDAIFAPQNGQIYNQFIDTLVNRIGMTYARSQSWRNPLAAFKRGQLQFGDKVQELQAKWITAHSYEDDKQTLLKVHRPEVAAVYHQVDRFDQYPISINRVEMRQSMVTENGVNELIASVMDNVINSSNYDEFIQMKNLISFYDANWGFFKIQLEEPNGDDSAKAFLKSLKAMVERLRFPSTLYNAQVLDDIPVFSTPEEMVLLCTPEAAASVDVDALATLFHLEPADAQVRRVIVDSFDVPGAYAMLTTRDWFQVYDQVYENGSFYNPETLTTNYYLTIMQVISCSPFVPAIIWTTEATDVKTITMTTDGTLTTSVASRDQRGNFSAFDSSATPITKAMVTGKNADGTYSDIDGIYIFGSLGGSLSDGTTSGVQTIDGISVRPDAYRVTGLSYSGTGAPQVNSRTYVDKYGRLHLQAGAYKSTDGLTLNVTVEPVYTNPTGQTPTPVATTVQLNIAGTGSTPPEPPTPSTALEQFDVMFEGNVVDSLTDPQTSGESINLDSNQFDGIRLTTGDGWSPSSAEFQYNGTSVDVSSLITSNAIDLSSYASEIASSTYFNISLQLTNTGGTTISYSIWIYTPTPPTHTVTITAGDSSVSMTTSAGSTGDLGTLAAPPSSLSFVFEGDLLPTNLAGSYTIGEGASTALTLVESPTYTWTADVDDVFSAGDNVHLGLEATYDGEGVNFEAIFSVAAESNDDNDGNG